jgi:hypothetical protein
MSAIHSGRKRGLRPPGEGGLKEEGSTQAKGMRENKGVDVDIV